MAIYFEDLNVGDELPTLVADISATQLFLMSAATQNAHRIHYDKDWALHEGYPERVIHGPLQGDLLAQLLQDWAGATGWLKRLAYSNRTYAVLGEILYVKGRVTELCNEAGRLAAELDVWVEKIDGTVTTPGTATVILPSRGQPIVV